jgi:Na+/melibiose symporter-like transporter
MPDRLTLAAYALPALPLAALYFPVYVFLAEFYAGTHGLSLAFIGAVFVGVRLFDAVTDPLMGMVSDRIRTRRGRRRPWLALGCPLVMLSAWMLFVPRTGVTGAEFAIWLVLLTLGWTVMLTPYFAWGAELATGYADRARVTVWRETTGLIGTIAAAVLYAAGGTAAAGLGNVALLVVIGLPLAVAACLWRVPEPRDFTRAVQPAGSLFAALRAEPLFGRLLLAYFLNGAANGLPATLFLFYAGDVLGAADAGGPLLVLYFVAAVAASPLWGWAVRRMPKHRVWCLAMILAGAVFACAAVLGPGDVAAFAVICALSGAMLGADLALPSAIQADLVDLDTARSGDQRTGAFFALWSLTTKAALAISGGAALIALDLIGFRSGQANSAAALTGLALLYALAPVAIKLAAVALMWGFPLDEARAADLRRAIEDQGLPQPVAARTAPM